MEPVVTQPTVSVIVPTYNRGDLVTQAVDSLLRQTVPPDEIIVVDDGSTDHTRAALEPFMARIRYIHQENGGLAAARNRGIRESRGELLAFLDSDDLWEPRMLEAALETFRRHPEAGAVFTADRDIDHNGHPTGRVHTKRSPGIHFTPLSMLTRDTGVGCGRPPIVRRAWVEKLGMFDETMRCAVDCDMWLRYAFSVPMVLQPEPLVRRRVHGANLSFDYGRDAEDWLRILDRLESSHADFVRGNRWAYRRVLAKHHLRKGRHLLTVAAGDRDGRREARRALLRAVRSYPFVIRPYLYVVWSYLAPSTYSRWRRWEFQKRHMNS